MTRWMICNSGESTSGWVANRMRSGIGNESTHWRTGTRGITQLTKWTAVCAMRCAPRGAKPAPLTRKRNQASRVHTARSASAEIRGRGCHTRKRYRTRLLQSRVSSLPSQSRLVLRSSRGVPGPPDTASFLQAAVVRTGLRLHPANARCRSQTIRQEGRASGYVGCGSRRAQAKRKPVPTDAPLSTIPCCD
jgi:hypothetical protein